MALKLYDKDEYNYRTSLAMYDGSLYIITRIVKSN